MYKYKNLADMIVVQAKQQPRKAYITFHDKKITYREVDAITSRLARLMQKHGLQKGERVALMLENSPEFIYAYYAVMKCDAVAVPINTFLKEEEVSYILKDCSVKMLITSNGFKKNAQAARKDVPSLVEIFTFEKPEFEAVNVYDSLESFSADAVENVSGVDDLAVLIYTSGTTGHPKGAMLTHGNLLSNAKGADEHIRPSKRDRFLLFLPMFHAYAFTVCVLLPTYLGSSIIILASVMELKKKTFKNILIFKRPTITVGVPQVFSALAKSAMPKWFIKFVYPIRLHVSGGAPLPMEILNQFKEKFGVPIIEGYGLSEASPVVSVNPLTKQKAGTVGTPLPGIQCKVVNDDLVEVPQGEVGELIVKGPNIMQGYWNLPEATDNTLKNGWLCTGDFATIDEEGYITIVDRKKDLILVKGMNVYPREIEELLYLYPGVSAAAVIGIPDGEGDEIPIAYITPAEGVTLSEPALKKYLKDHLANFKIPRKFVLDAEIPLNATGKVMKRKLKEMVIEEMKNL